MLTVYSIPFLLSTANIHASVPARTANYLNYVSTSKHLIHKWVTPIVTGLPHLNSNFLGANGCSHIRI